MKSETNIEVSQLLLVDYYYQDYFLEKLVENLKVLKDGQLFLLNYENSWLVGVCKIIMSNFSNFCS